MTEIDRFAPNTPIWIDVASPDLEATVAFYTGLFGWDASWAPLAEEPADGETAGAGYSQFTLRGRNVAGAGPAWPGLPTSWTTYIGVKDLDETLRLVEAAGGQLLIEPVDVVEAGRLAVVADAHGISIALWQPLTDGTDDGLGLAGEPGSLCWTELATPDVSQAKDFYQQVFGWDTELPATTGIPYTQWSRNGQPFGGMLQLTQEVPEIQPGWTVYFAVDDCDRTVAEVERLGGQVQIPPTDIDPGRFAVVTDPVGARFCLIRQRPGRVSPLADLVRQA